MATQAAHVIDRPLAIDRTRDALLTPFGRATLADRYLLPGEGPQDLFARVARSYADDPAHAAAALRLHVALWFLPATPILSNGGTDRGLPISCFLNAVEDDLGSIVDTWSENVWLASNGGGIGTYWGGVRSIGEPVRGCGHTSGHHSVRARHGFADARDLAGLAAARLCGRLHRRAPPRDRRVRRDPQTVGRLQSQEPEPASRRLHHRRVHARRARRRAVRAAQPAHRRAGARSLRAPLWQRLLETRLQTGEPYLLFIDTANRHLAPHQRAAGLTVRQSNLCSEILLPTGRDHLGHTRTAVCCLASVNLERWDEWCGNEGFVEDVLRMLDNVLEDFIERAPDSMAAARYSAARERSVGLGAMGFHSYLQQSGIPFESALARSANLRMFRHLRREADTASERLAAERGACPDAAERGVMERFSHKLAIAPTASISVICGGTSACIEPIPANVYTHKTLSGSFSVRNEALQKVLAAKNLDSEETWQSILAHEGSVQHLPELSEQEKAVFRTAFEIDQRWVIELAGDRAPLLCQGQSLNLYLNSDTHKWDLLMLHWTAWERGIKSLYYCRSKSVQRAGFAGVDADNTRAWRARPLEANADRYDECLACQ